MRMMDDGGAKKGNQSSVGTPSAAQYGRPSGGVLVPFIFSKAWGRFVWETINGVFERFSHRVRYSLGGHESMTPPGKRSTCRGLRQC
jgi:hypothetical protein